MPVPNSDGQPVTSLFGASVPQSTGAPGSETAPTVPPSVSAREGVGAGFGQASVGDAQPDGANPQYSRPGLLSPGDGYASTGAGQGSGHMPHPNSMEGGDAA